MTGRIIHTPKVPTPCERGRCEGPPFAGLHRPGTIWQCDDCGKRWVVVEGSQYNQLWKAWRVLTTQNRDGEDR